MKGLVMKYFVLNPHKRSIYGKASRLAILEYARIIKVENITFGEDLENWIKDIETEIIKQQTQ